MRVFAALALLLLAPASASQVLVEVADGRTSGPYEDLQAWESRPAVREALAAAGRYWREARPFSEWAFEVRAVAEGSFTRTGAAQHAVLYRVGTSGSCAPSAGSPCSRRGGSCGNLA